MRRSTTPKRVRPWLFLGGIAVLLAALVAIATDEQGAPEVQAPVPAASAAGDAAVTPPGVGGLRRYRDPVTGERRSPPPGLAPAALSAAERRALSRSHEGLVEVPGRDELP